MFVYTRRDQLHQAALASLAAFWPVAVPAGAAAGEPAVEVLDEVPGFGKHAIRSGDLVMLHYTGRVGRGASGTVFDTTLGEDSSSGTAVPLTYRDGGPGVYRPALVRVAGFPTPGVPLGMQQALVGMRIGGTRTVVLPPELAFGSQVALAPYGMVPAGADVTYELRVLRVSARGPDELMQGIDKCSAGGASASAEKCRDITPLEAF